MKRFMGLMPADAVEISRSYKDASGLEITIEAGPHGWTIIYADQSTCYTDSERCAEINFREALDIANEDVGPLAYIGDNLLCEIDAKEEL